MMDKFHYLKFGLALVLMFVGAKMLLAGVYKIPIWASLAVIAALLAGSVDRVAVASTAERTRSTQPRPSPSGCVLVLLDSFGFARLSSRSSGIGTTDERPSEPWAAPKGRPAAPRLARQGRPSEGTLPGKHSLRCDDS